MAAFISWCRANNVRVFAGFPATIFFPDYDGPTAQSVFEQIAAFYQAQGVPVLGTARGVMHDRSWFYDTAYHPLDANARLNTEELVDLARPYLSSEPGVGTARLEADPPGWLSEDEAAAAIAEK